MSKAYDADLLAQAPEPTKAQIQGGYQTKGLLDQYAQPTSSVPTSGSPAPQTGLSGRETDIEKENDYGSRGAPVDPKRPFWRSTKGIAVIIIVLLVILGAVIGGAVGGHAAATSHNNSSSSGSSNSTTTSTSTSTSLTGNTFATDSASLVASASSVASTSSDGNNFASASTPMPSSPSPISSGGNSSSTGHD